MKSHTQVQVCTDREAASKRLAIVISQVQTLLMSFTSSEASNGFSLPAKTKLQISKGGTQEGPSKIGTLGPLVLSDFSHRDHPYPFCSSHLEITVVLYALLSFPSTWNGMYTLLPSHRPLLCPVASPLEPRPAPKDLPSSGSSPYCGGREHRVISSLACPALWKL